MGSFTALAIGMAMLQASVGEARPAGASAFQQLKALVGDWRARRADGSEIGVNYRLSARDTVLVETWQLGPNRESLTIYHMDGSELMATHYCPWGNQPRLKLVQTSDGRFDFAFHDATGLQPDHAVQHAFWIEIGADGTFTRSETYLQGEHEESEVITYRRVSP